MAVLLVFAALFLACSRNVVSSAYCDTKHIPFPGFIQGTTRLYLNGESFLPSCLEGYKPSIPNGKLTCKNGVWSGHFPPCTASTCVSPPPSIDHGKVKNVSGQHASKVQYECDRFYYLAVEPSLYCYFGKWQGTLPICKYSNCHFGDLKQNEGVLPLNTSFTQTGDNLSFQCAPGYEKNTIKPFCSKGSWIEFGLSPCKERGCIVPDIRNGALMELEERQIFKWKTLRQEQKLVLKKAKKGSSVPSGQKLELVCDSKHSFEGKGG